MTRLTAAVLMVTLFLPVAAGAQPVPSGVWRDFAAAVDVGSELNVRLTDGRRFRATLVRVDDASVLLQPKTRVPVPVQAVPYAAIASLEKRQQRGIVEAKAIAIGAGVGAAAFWAMVGIMLAIYSD